MFKALISAASVVAVSIGSALALPTTVLFGDGMGNGIENGEELNAMMLTRSDGMFVSVGVDTTSGLFALGYDITPQTPANGDRDLNAPVVRKSNNSDVLNSGVFLVLSETGEDLSGSVDDVRSGGFISFDFSKPVTLFSADLADTKPQTNIVLTLSDGSTQTFGQATSEGGPGDLDSPEDNNPGTLNFFDTLFFGTDGVSDVVKMVVNFSDSGALVNFVYDGPGGNDFGDVPLPAGLPLIITGLAAMRIARRRRG